MVFVLAEYAHARAGFTSYGRIRKPAERVAEEACRACARFHKRGQPVDRHLADQLLLPLSLAQQDSQYAVSAVTRHLLTNAWLIKQFLDVDIDYRGTWYRETFSYTREAENIAHFVIVMPESQVDRATADQIFSSIDFLLLPDVLTIREDRAAFAWALDYLHEAPGGYFRGQFEPGAYYVAAAFVAAPLNKEEAGVPDDTILYAGMTGGGASTDYWKIQIAPGENAIIVSLTDSEGWACPWLYV